jgi:hypothetical protein
VKKNLLAGGEHKLRSAINAYQSSIGIRHGRSQKKGS